MKQICILKSLFWIHNYLTVKFQYVREDLCNSCILNTTINQLQLSKPVVLCKITLLTQLVWQVTCFWTLLWAQYMCRANEVNILFFLSDFAIHTQHLHPFIHPCSVMCFFPFICMSMYHTHTHISQLSCFVLFSYRFSQIYLFSYNNWPFSYSPLLLNTLIWFFFFSGFCSILLSTISLCVTVVNNITTVSIVVQGNNVASNLLYCT